MTPAQVVVTLAGAALAVAVNVYFAAPGRVRARRGGARAATRPEAGAGGGALIMPGERPPAPPAGPQEVRIRVRDGYDPAVIEVEAGRPVKLLFRREEVAGCSDTVMIPEWKIVQRLPAYKETAVEFTPRTPGEYPFTCGMNMLRGTIVVR